MSKLLSVFSSTLKMKFFFLKKLPSLFFWKIEVEEIDSQKAVISIPYSWKTQNPFKSIYFSALAGAAELSTGLLAFVSVENKNMSMLVVGMKAEFVKKANTKCYFICDQGKDIQEIVDKAIETQEGQSVTVVSKGFNENDELIANFEFTWSFKQRKA